MGLVILTKYKRENKQTLKKNPESYRVLEVKIYYILNNNSTPLSKHFALNKTISVLSCLPFSQTFMIVGSMSIECCPVLTPTWNEFKNFSNYVEKVDKLYKSRYGMVKVHFIKSDDSPFLHFFYSLRLCPLQDGSLPLPSTPQNSTTSSSKDP